MNIRLKSGGSDVYYRVSGSGRPVMLIHGFGETGEVWSEQASALSAICKLIIPDLPGSGRSPLINEMSMEGLAEVMHAIIHAEDIDRCTMIGHSMGGYITLAFAEKYNNHLDGFGLFHSTAYADTDEKKDIRRKGIAFLEKNGAFEFLKTTTPNLFSPLTRDENPRLVSDFIATQHNFSMPALVTYNMGMMERPDRTAILKESTDPVLFVIGNADAAVPPGDMFKQSHLPENSYIHLLQRSGHMGMLEEPEKTTRILQGFISRD